MDGLFLVDILINFCSAIENEGYQIIDGRKAIAILYMKSWFIIDFVAIVPFDLLLQGSSSANSLIRVTRIGKLYKLVKITRLVRLIKVIKQQGKIFDRLNDIFKIGEGFERLLFSLLLFLMLCHFMACVWVFTADMSVDELQHEEHDEMIEDSTTTNWIIDGSFDTNVSTLYITAFYFTVTTITTVGYGDISGVNSTERVICIFLMILGVLFFSFSSGTLTSIITNYEEVNHKLQNKKLLLNRIYKEYNLSSDLYFEVLTSIKYDTNNDLEDINIFVDSLPIKLR